MKNRINNLKPEKFQAIRSKCEQLRELSPLIITCHVKPPITNEPHAFVTVTLPLPAMLTDLKARVLLSRLFMDADNVMLAKTDTGIAISFCVENIWTEEA